MPHVRCSVGRRVVIRQTGALIRVPVRGGCFGRRCGVDPPSQVCKGPLWRALEDGYLFFADEFNLAEPAVLNMLMVRRMTLAAVNAVGARPHPLADGCPPPQGAHLQAPARPQTVPCLCVLCVMPQPLLEGKQTVVLPGSDTVIPVHPNFRFFAAQNDAAYGGRKQLPVSLRARFLQTQVLYPCCRITLHIRLVSTAPFVVRAW
jgi:hypothetical protein